MCRNCIKEFQHIDKLKAQITKLEKQYSLSVNKLHDLAIRGQKIVEQDLESVDIFPPREDTQIIVKVLEDDSKFDPLTVGKNLHCVAEYLGNIRLVRVSNPKVQKLFV